MKYTLTLIILFLFTGCALKQGDVVEYSYKNYAFVKEMFIDQKFQCIELGTIEKSNIDVKYCKSHNYANEVVQGFMFSHRFESDSERLIAANLELKAKKRAIIACSSQTLDGDSAYEEYVLCMVSQKHFDLYGFLMQSPTDIEGVLNTPLGNRSVYTGHVREATKKLIKTFIDGRFTTVHHQAL